MLNAFLMKLFVSLKSEESLYGDSEKNNHRLHWSSSIIKNTCSQYRKMRQLLLKR